MVLDLVVLVLAKKNSRENRIPNRLMTFDDLFHNFMDQFRFEAVRFIIPFSIAITFIITKSTQFIEHQLPK
jgi:hypothetical protein